MVTGRLEDVETVVIGAYCEYFLRLKVAIVYLQTCFFEINCVKCILNSLRHADFGQVVEVVAVGEEGGLETGGVGGGREGGEVDVEPGEGAAFHLAVLHAVGEFAVVVVGGEVEVAVFVFKEVADVGGVEDEAAAGGEEGLDVGEEMGQSTDGADDANAVHEHEQGVETALHGPEVLLYGVADAAGLHCFDRERRDVDGRDVETALLQDECVATGTGTDIEHAAAAVAQGLLFEWRHGVEGAEKRVDGHFVFVEVGREHAQAVGPSVFVIVGNGRAHGVVLGSHVGRWGRKLREGEESGEGWGV